MQEAVHDACSVMKYKRKWDLNLKTQYYLNQVET